MSTDRIWERRSKYDESPRANQSFNPANLRSTTSRHASGSQGGSKGDLKIDTPGATGFGSGRRTAGTPGTRGNPFSAITAAPSAGLPTPTTGGAAFGLGSGAFASFGGSKPKTPGAGKVEAGDKQEKDISKTEDSLASKQSSSSLDSKITLSTSSEHPTKNTWVVWYRPPTSKNSDYEKSTIALGSFSTIEQFWTLYSHLKRPSTLPAVSDYHIFKKGIRPVWEDEENKKGGKWIVRLRKGVADRYWEDLLLAIVGDQFLEAGDEVCGAVLSVRTGEDVLNVWTRLDGGRNIRVRETIKRLLAFPADTNLIWKSHDSSIAQRSAIDQARQDKTTTGTQNRRRDTLMEDSTPERTR